MKFIPSAIVNRYDQKFEFFNLMYGRLIIYNLSIIHSGKKEVKFKVN